MGKCNWFVWEKFSKAVEGTEYKNEQDINISLLAKVTNFISKRDFNVIEADKGYFPMFQEKLGLCRAKHIEAM